jgi:perosamine synthetase
MPVHILGHPVDMDPILEIASEFNLVVIEDATESLGAKYRDRMVGSLGSIACFSFNGNKLITTGGGGMIVTEDEEIARKTKYLTTQAKDDPVEYTHHEIGFNYRLVNLLAAMGVAQMEQVDDFIKAKKQIATRYASGLSDIPGVGLMPEASWASSTGWLYTIRINEDKCGLGSREVFRKFREMNIQTRPLWTPIHLSRAHQKSYGIGGEVAESLWRQSLSLPCSVGLSIEDQLEVIRHLQDWLS